MEVMTIEEFNNLDEESKQVIIFEADKISERKDDFTKYELFTIHDFFIEIKTSVSYDSKRVTTLYTLNNLPAIQVKLWLWP